MSLQSRLSDLITAIGTDYKQLRTWITGSSSGTLASLATTDKNSLVAAVNEVKAIADSAAGGGWTPVDASETVKGIAEVATSAEMTAGTADNLIVTPLKLEGRLSTVTVPDASDTVKGKVELATDAEATTGTDTTRAVTPANVAAVFTNRIATSTSLGTSNTLVPSQNAVKAYADALIAANDAMVFKGVIDASANPNYPASNRGDTYRISVAGKIGGASGVNVEVGDLLIALTDGTASGTQAAVGAQWNIVQSNLDGAVTGPASSTASNLASFSGTTGKVIADSGFSTDNDSTLAANSSTRLPTQAAVKAYAQPLDSDLTAIAALTTTAYGRGFLALADQAALMALVAAASETVAGKIEIATQTETNTGTDDVRAITPLKLASNVSTLFGVPDTDLVALYTAAKA